MSYLYLTSDAHLGHANIAIFCDRPVVLPEDLNDDGWWVSREAAIQCAKRMDEWIISRMNSRIKPEDTVIHVGDFCNKGRNVGVEGLRNKAEYYEDRLNGKWIFVTGNHDGNNGLKSTIDFMKMRMGRKQVFIRHHPVYDYGEIPEDTDFCAVGHVHEKWQYRFIEGTYIPNINVGLDAQGYYPVRLDELVGQYHRIMNKELGNGRNKS